MPDLTDKELIAECMARAEKATKGPWGNPYNRREVRQMKTGPVPFDMACCYDGIIARCEEFDNGDFIAAAREDIPLLCSRLESSNAEREKMREVLEDARESIDDEAPHDSYAAGVNEGIREVLDRFRRAALLPSPPKEDTNAE